MTQKTIIVAAAMIFSVMLAHALTPGAKAPAAPVDLESLIPRQVGEWGTVHSSNGLETADNPVARKIYDSVLMRTYQNPRGEILWLAVAYGSDQRDELSVHLPEVCYAVQGFSVTESITDKVKTTAGDIEVRRVVASNRERTESITYWVRVGDKIVTSGIGRKMEQLRHAFSGNMPDGILVRVSQPADDKETSYRAQDEFLKQLLAAANPEGRGLLAGKH